MIEAAQVRAARALIDWSQSKLAETAGVPLSIVERFETGAPDHVANEAIDKMRHALEAAGVAGAVAPIETLRSDMKASLPVDSELIPVG